MKNLLLAAAAFFGFAAASMGQTLPAYLPGYSVLDADGNDYETVIIGNQQWTKRNLLTSRFSNGDSIANVIDGTEWYFILNNPTPAWCSVGNNVQEDSMRGRLYNWYAVNDPRNLCPVGWRTPNEADWDSLILFLDPSAVLDTLGFQSLTAGGALKDTLNYLWAFGNVGATNSTGFSARPAGIRGYYGDFYSGDIAIFLWSNTESNPNNAYFRGIDPYSTSVDRNTTQGIDNKTTGGSVRCVKGAPKIKGFLFNDLNNNCVRDNGESGIGNTALTINGGSTNVQTNSDGYWFLDSLALGAYTLSVNANSPVSFNCNAGFNVLGNETGIFQFAASVDSSNNNGNSCNPLPSNLQNGLLGYWPFCGNANDESGNGNDGTVNGATLTEDRFGVANAAYDFDGVNDFIELTENVLPANNNSYSIHFWAFLNKDTSRVESYTVFDDRDQNSFGSKGRFIVSSNTDETYSYQMGDNEACSNNNFQSNLWTSIACIYDNENDVITVYKDGNLSCTSSYGDDSFYPGLRKLLIGKGKSPAFSSVEEWKGQIDDIAIYNRALTPEEVQQLYTLNACTFTIYDTVTVTQTVYDTVSVSVSTTDTLIINTLITAVQPAQENTFLVYPNPAGSQITINNGNVGILGGYTLRITNSAGQEVYNQNITQAEVTLDLSNWGGNGLYVLYITDPQGEIIAVKQIVLQ
jgi:uncharacterized protein (TIGR02145 family)